MWMYLQLLIFLTQVNVALCNVVSFKYDLVQRPSSQDSTRDLPNRVIKAVEEPLFNEEYFYRINATVGTPPQRVQLLVDTGSSDTWVLDSTNSLCVENQSNRTIAENMFNCTEVGAFNRSKSSSYRYEHSNFTIRYGDNTYAKGDFGTDVFGFSNISVAGLGIGIGTEANSSIGIMGIGLKGNEAMMHTNKSKHLETNGYDNLPLLLKNQGHIDRIAYSIALESTDADSGDLLFGGVDHSKYKGNLWTVPMVNLFPNMTENPIEFTVSTEKITLSPGHCQPPYPVSSRKLTGLMDTGTTLTYLPQDIVNQIAHSVDSHFNANVGGYIHPCSNIQEDSVITYYFSGVPIDVRLQDAQFRLLDESGTQTRDDHNNTMCILGFYGVSHDDDVIFGDSFMRSAYVVFDLERYQISIAQSNRNSTTPQIEPITGAIPNSKMASQYTRTERFVGRCRFADTNDTIVTASVLNYSSFNKHFYPTNGTLAGRYRNETEKPAIDQRFDDASNVIVTDPSSKPSTDPVNNLESPINIKDDMTDRADSAPIYVPDQAKSDWAPSPDSTPDVSNMVTIPAALDTANSSNINNTTEVAIELENLIQDDSRFDYYSPPKNGDREDEPIQIDDNSVRKKDPVDFISLLTQFGSAGRTVTTKTITSLVIAVIVALF